MADGAGRRRAGGVATAAPSTAQRALELAYRYLNQRERTVQELQRYLIGRELEPDAVEDAVAELTEIGYLDDARYARLFVEDKRALEQWGSERIRRELLRRGIDPELIATVLAADDAKGTPGSTATELERAIALLRQRFPNPPRERRDRQRALGALVRRGYVPELAIDAITAYARDEP